MGSVRCKVELKRRKQQQQPKVSFHLPSLAAISAAPLSLTWEIGSPPPLSPPGLRRSCNCLNPEILPAFFQGGDM